MTTKTKIVIAGGGSAGWMAALYLNQYFNHSHSQVQIEVIESDSIGTIGVGEATVHSIRYFFAAMGLDENELIARTNATLKTGILFRNWMQPQQQETHEYFHPFEQQHVQSYLDTASCWLNCKGELKQRYDQAVSFSSLLLRENLVPKHKNSKTYEGIVPYGYHLDATLLGQFLREKATAAGVIWRTDTIREVVAEGDEIKRLVGNKQEYTADFFIDCTGFRALLIKELQGDNWQSFEDALPCNRAVAMQWQYENQQPKAYTTATALSSGWAWEIDLSSRRGTGYVYDGSLLTREQAESELKQHLGYKSEPIKTLHLNMNIGCRQKFWLGNCVAIGLSAGFIEPLESTGLHLINMGLRLFATHFSSRQKGSEVQQNYNRLMTGVYDDLKQFIVLHYCLSDRRDTEFWRKVAHSASFCPGLVEKLDIWKHKVCEYMDLAGGYSSIFNDENYRYILYGMQHYPELMLPHQAINQQKLNELSKQMQNLASQCLSLDEYLDNLSSTPNINPSVKVNLY